MPLASLRSTLLRVRIDVLARSFALLAGFGLSVASAGPTAAAGTAFILIAVAIIMTWWSAAEGVLTSTYLHALAAEAAFTLLLVALSPSAADPYVIYLTAPALLAGLRGGIWSTSVVVIAETASLLVIEAQGATTHAGYLGTVSPWILTGLGFGLLGSWIRQLRLIPRDSTLSPYASAHRLLGQLRTIIRDLPGGLDIEVVSDNVLSTATDALEGNRAALLLNYESGEPTVVAHHGDEQFTLSLPTDPVVTRTMHTGRPIQAPVPHGQSAHRFRSYLPLTVGTRSIGAVVVDGSVSVPADMLDDVQRTLDDDSLRLESAVLFSDVKAVATVEERRRLAREIHDGIAQEIASLGYLVDDLAQDRCSLDHQSGLIDLRDELTRIVTELRLSIFDLRTDVSNNAGLGSVLADYVREVGKSSGLAVHVSLEESRNRLRLDVETELLRIAQEAVTNARKHSGGENIWVTCRVEPPFAEVRVEDDGRGHVMPRNGHYGLHVMNERAARINAVLNVGERPGGGTLVSAVLLPAEVAIPTLAHVGPANGGAHVLHSAVS